MRYNAAVWDKTIAAGDDGYLHDFDNLDRFSEFLRDWLKDPSFSHAEIWVED